MELGQMRASCSRWRRIDSNSEGTWDPLKTLGPEGVGAELARGNRGACCRGGWAGKRPSPEDRLGVGESVDAAAFPFLEPHVCLGSCPGEEMQGRDEEPHVAWLLPEDSHLGGRVATPESPEGGGVEGASMPALLSFPDGGGSIQLCRSAPVSWHLPGDSGILTLRDQPVADGQKHCPPSQQARPRSVPRGQGADVAEEPGFSGRTRRQVPVLALRGCVPLGIWARLLQL